MWSQALFHLRSFDYHYLSQRGNPFIHSLLRPLRKECIPQSTLVVVNLPHIEQYHYLTLIPSKNSRSSILIWSLFPRRMSLSMRKNNLYMSWRYTYPKLECCVCIIQDLWTFTFFYLRYFVRKTLIKVYIKTNMSIYT